MCLLRFDPWLAAKDQNLLSAVKAESLILENICRQFVYLNIIYIYNYICYTFIFASICHLLSQIPLSTLQRGIRWRHRHHRGSFRELCVAKRALPSEVILLLRSWCRSCLHWIVCPVCPSWNCLCCHFCEYCFFRSFAFYFFIEGACLKFWSLCVGVTFAVHQTPLQPCMFARRLAIVTSAVDTSSFNTAQRGGIFWARATWHFRDSGHSPETAGGSTGRFAFIRADSLFSLSFLVVSLPPKWPVERLHTVWYTHINGSLIILAKLLKLSKLSLQMRTAPRSISWRSADWKTQ